MSESVEPQPEALQQRSTTSDARELATLERQRSMGETVLGGNIGVFTNGDAFRLARNMAEFLAASTMIPQDYQGRPENVMVAIDYAARLGISPFALMSNMDIVRGRPALRGQLYAGVINSSRMFPERIKYEWRGEEDTGDGLPSENYGCRAWVFDINGERVNGPWVDWAMVTKEGWNVDKPNRNGNGVQVSKWNTMRELMFFYRAAAFFGRTQAPDLMMGIYQHEELEDTGFIDGDYSVVPREPTLADRVNERTEAKPAAGSRRRNRRQFTDTPPAAPGPRQETPPADAEASTEPDSSAPPFELEQAGAAEDAAAADEPIAERSETASDTESQPSAEAGAFNVE